MSTSGKKTDLTDITIEEAERDEKQFKEAEAAIKIGAGGPFQLVGSALMLDLIDAKIKPADTDHDLQKMRFLA